MKQREDILKGVEQCFKEIFLGKIDKIHYSDRIEEELGIDSMGITELVFGLEDKFGIEISDEELFEIKYVDNIIDLIISKTDPSIQKRAG